MKERTIKMDRLERRCRRLLEQLEKGIPDLIIKNEIRLIKEACDDLMSESE